MAMHGGRTPYDENGALVGPARCLYAPTTVAVPTAMTDIIATAATSGGEYPAATGWKDFGLAADAPSYTHSRDSEGITYQQPSGDLFQQISNITRSLTVQVAHIDDATLAVIENAAAATTVGAFKKVSVGLYADAPVWRVALISFRPAGVPAVVTDANAPGGSRPPLVARVIPRSQITADETSSDFDRGTPVNFGVTFNAVSEPTAAAGAEHGFWLVEQGA